MVRHRVRIRFRKQGDLRWIGHRDLMRCFERWFRRSGIELKRSEGFHPKPRMTFPSALAVGIAGVDEVMEFEINQPDTAQSLAGRLAEHAPPGLDIKAVECLPPEAKKGQVCHAAYTVPIPPAHRDGLAERIANVIASSTWPLERPNRSAPVDLREFVEELSLREDALHVRLAVRQEGSIGPRDVLAALGLPALEHEGICMTRTAVELCP
jgi:radical SAM-linked protein